MLFGAKMVLCALAGLSASLRSAAKLPAAAHKTPFLLLISHNIQVRPKKRRKPYLRYLWLDLNKTKTGINHFKSTISTT
jgi:hypothetical protein